MNKKCRKLLLREFEKLFQAEFPNFSIDKSATLPSGWRLYKLRWYDKVVVYLTLVVMQKSDEFTLEIGWSSHGRYPSHLGTMVPVGIPRCNIWKDEPQDGEFLFRIGCLMPSGEDFLWKASRKPGLCDPIDDLLSGNIDLGETPDEEYEDPELLNQSVSESVSMFKEYVIPFLEQTLGPPEMG